MAFGPAIRVPSDASAALWIAPTLGSFGTVGGLVPQGYERYLLFDYRGGEPHGWDGVCRLFEQLLQNCSIACKLLEGLEPPAGIEPATCDYELVPYI